MKLNEQQRKAVETIKGRVLVLAGAGSGKTRVIVYRTAYMIQQGIRPDAILGLTFTKKAAFEMRERLKTLIQEQAKQVTFCTFHSFCMQVLRQEIERLGYTKNFSLYDERDLHRLIQQIAKEMLGTKGQLPSLAPTQALIAKAFNQDLKIEEFSWHDTFVKELYSKLLTTLRAHNALSFDTLISLTIELFEKHPDTLQKYQNQFHYLMIDEYQDTNQKQFHLAELLANKRQNICVVGDDDQSIYSWRGADVKNILNFKASHFIRLEQNYRSSQTILKAANALICHNQNRHKKNLWSLIDNPEPIEIFHAPTDQEETKAVIERILQCKKRGGKWSDIAILYRSNSLSRQFEMALMQASYQTENGSWVRGIPYEVFGGLEFSERSEIKDILAYLRVIANPLDQEALLRIINVPRRGISNKFLDQITQQNRAQKIPLWQLLKEQKKPAISQFIDLIELCSKKFQTPPFTEALHWLIETINYKKAIQEEVKSEKMRAFKWENVQECINAIQISDDETLQDFVANTTLKNNPTQNYKKKNTDRVHLMTFHSAKGLEFPNCFLVCLEDGILPHEKSMRQTGLEEERRLFYVGITRAQKQLTLSMARNRMRMGKTQPTTPSRFLYEIPKHLLKGTHHKIFT